MCRFCAILLGRFDRKLDGVKKSLNGSNEDLKAVKKMAAAMFQVLERPSKVRRRLDCLFKFANICGYGDDIEQIFVNKVEERRENIADGMINDNILDEDTDGDIVAQSETR